MQGMISVFGVAPIDDNVVRLALVIGLEDYAAVTASRQLSCGLFMANLSKPMRPRMTAP